MNSVEIYTKSYCPYCARAKELLDSLDVDYKEHVLDDEPEEFDELKKRTNHMTVPQIFIKGNFLGGSDDLAALVESGELHDLLEDN